jgi:hypothetical protein
MTTGSRPSAARALWKPAGNEAERVAAFGALALLGLSASALALCALAMPPDYSVQTHRLSEAAAQGTPNGWIARLGFLTFGQAVLWLAAAYQYRWARIAWWPHALFGVFMMGAAAFSEAPWLSGIAADVAEGRLHSSVAIAMGFAFTIGTIARFIQRRRASEGGGTFDVLAAAASTLLPLLMLAAPNYIGITQRVMFAISYAWYAREALQILRVRHQ